MNKSQSSKSFKRSSSRCLLHTKGGGGFFISCTELKDGSIEISDGHHTVNSWTDENGNISPIFYLLSKSLLPESINLKNDGEITVIINKKDSFDKTASTLALNVFMISHYGNSVKH